MVLYQLLRYRSVAFKFGILNNSLNDVIALVLQAEAKSPEGLFGHTNLLLRLEVLKDNLNLLGEQMARLPE